jgi:quercetin dioxygenase-like cupin family protein
MGPLKNGVDPVGLQHPRVPSLVAEDVRDRLGDLAGRAVHGVGWEDGGMPDAIPPVNLAGLAAGGNHPGALWRLDGEDLQANLVRLGRGDRIEPHRNDEVDVLVVVVLGRGELTLDGQVHQLAPMVVAHLPKGAVRAVEPVDGLLVYLSIHRHRSAGLRVGRPPSDAEAQRAGRRQRPDR